MKRVRIPPEWTQQPKKKERRAPNPQQAHNPEREKQKNLPLPTSIAYGSGFCSLLLFPTLGALTDASVTRLSIPVATSRTTTTSPETTSVTLPAKSSLSGEEEEGWGTNPAQRAALDSLAARSAARRRAEEEGDIIAVPQSTTRARPARARASPRSE